MGTSHLIPSGALQGTRLPPQVWLFNIRVLYSEAVGRSEIYGLCSIRSISHTRKTWTQTDTSPRFIHSSFAAWIQRRRERDRLMQIQTTQTGKGRLRKRGRAKRWDERIETRMETENESSVQVRPSTPWREMRQEVPRKIKIIGHTHFPSFFFFLLHDTRHRLR